MSFLSVDFGVSYVILSHFCAVFFACFCCVWGHSIEEGQCCLGRDSRIGRLNGLQVYNTPCQIVLRQSGAFSPFWHFTHARSRKLRSQNAAVACGLNHRSTFPTVNGYD
eukprot:COSAG05_NODE_615_length_8327_cov_6.112543_7_plen_109_part_00